MTEHINVDSRPYVKIWEQEILDRRDNLVTEYDLSQAEAEMIVVLGMSDKELGSLSSVLKADLIGSIAGSEAMVPNPDSFVIIPSLQRIEFNGKEIPLEIHEDNRIEENWLGLERSKISADDALTRLYASVNEGENNAYTVWRRDKEAAFAFNAATDPILGEARRNWDNLDVDERLEVLRHAHDLHVQAYEEGNSYGFSPVPFNLDDLGENTRGLHSIRPDGTHDIRIDREYLASASFVEALGTGNHESTHALQYDLTVAIKTGVISQEDPIYYDAVIMDYNFSEYHDSEVHGFERYSDNFIEEDANASKTAAWIAGTFDIETGTPYADLAAYDLDLAGAYLSIRSTGVENYDFLMQLRDQIEIRYAELEEREPVLPTVQTPLVPSDPGVSIEQTVAP